MRKKYPSDLTDKQWDKISNIFTSALRGRPRTIDAREVVNAILYVMKNGCAWRSLPHDFPAWQTVYVQRMRWTMQGKLTQAQMMLSSKNPSVGIIDSTFIESAYGGGLAKASGYKRATGHSIHVVIDKTSTPLVAFVQSANIHDAQVAKAVIVEQFFGWLSKWRRIAKNWCFSFKGFTIDLAWTLFGLQLRRKSTV